MAEAAFASLRGAVDSLQEALRLHQLVPLIGPAVLTVEIETAAGGTRTAPFYRLVAERLLEQHGLDIHLLDSPSESWDLHRATAAIIGQQGSTPQRLRRSTAAAIRELSGQVKPAGALAALARLDLFDLVICLTPDDLLANAIRAAQGDGLQLHTTSYSTRQDISEQVDVPPRRAGELRLFHPLGRAEVTSEFAIHEEDALEYLYRFRDEGERRAKTLLSALRQSDRLFLGCPLPDWLGRGLIRLANDQRLAATNDRGMEFFCASASDDSLTDFLNRFSPNSIVFPWTPDEFVTELARLGGGDRPGASRSSSPGLAHGATAAGRAATPAATHAPTAFVSYASEDVDAARRLADALRGAGFGEVWLDKKRLVVGDDWSDRIDEAIGACDFFIPVLSQQADQRREGVYWEEWRKAVARSLRMADAFILPIGIDAASPQAAGYRRIFTGATKGLNDLHLMHAPAGALSGPALDELRARCDQFMGQAAGGGSRRG
ncbi:MAG: hypothetical protein RLZZ584_3545 [Pseudomonadota bacterium]|jgi:hypothetical protein